MKKKKKLKADEIKPVVVNRTLGFSSKFKEELFSKTQKYDIVIYKG